MFLSLFCTVRQRQKQNIQGYENYSKTLEALNISLEFKFSKGSKWKLSIEEAIKTESRQLTDNRIFIILDSGENTPHGYQKARNRIVFGVKCDLRYKAKIIASGNWIEMKRKPHTLEFLHGYSKN
jgi:hypothetical protein